MCVGPPHIRTQMYKLWSTFCQPVRRARDENCDCSATACVHISMEAYYYHSIDHFHPPLQRRMTRSYGAYNAHSIHKRTEKHRRDKPRNGQLPLFIGGKTNFAIIITKQYNNVRSIMLVKKYAIWTIMYKYIYYLGSWSCTEATWQLCVEGQLHQFSIIITYFAQTEQKL